MRPQKDYLVDRRKVEARQRVQLKRTNRSIDFLRVLIGMPFGVFLREPMRIEESALTSYWWSPDPKVRLSFNNSLPVN
jgi:hypothetical protein